MFWVGNSVAAEPSSRSNLIRMSLAAAPGQDPRDSARRTEEVMHGGVAFRGHVNQDLPRPLLEELPHGSRRIEMAQIRAEQALRAQAVPAGPAMSLAPDVHDADETT